MYVVTDPTEKLGVPPEIIHFVGKKWVVPIFKEFATHKQVRFGELKDKFSITPKVLSEILGEMKDFGFGFKLILFSLVILHHNFIKLTILKNDGSWFIHTK